MVYPECWHFDNDAKSKIDDVLTEHGGLLHVLPLAVHLSFFAGQVGGTILRHYYSLSIVVGGGGVVAHKILVSAQGLLVFGFSVYIECPKVLLTQS